MESERKPSENVLHLQFPQIEQQSDAHVVLSGETVDNNREGSLELPETSYETGKMLKLSGSVFCQLK